ncbi:MAG: MFS transporter [Gammaproteobacteria bacterium]
MAWALYDWANSAFALAVLTAFVPVMLADTWNDGAPSTVTTFRLGIANGLASLVVVLIAPLLGAMTDQARRRKPWLALFTILGVIATMLLATIGQGGWLLALLYFVAASVGFFAANSLYDAMLIDVAEPTEFDRVSSLGYGLGYLGGALLFTASVVLLARPAAFGLEGQADVIQLTFVMVGIWWTVFSLPLLWWVKEKQVGLPPAPGAFRAGLRQLRETLRTLKTEPNLLWFLGAYWLYIDGVYTIIKMAVDYGLSQGLSATDVTGAILLTNFLGFPAAIAFGALATRIGPRHAIYIGLVVYIVATALAVFLTSALQFYGLAATIGLVQGGVQSLSRSLYARLIPPAKSGEYFGFFNMLGKFSSILGPVLAGTAALVSGSQRVGILSIVILFGSGLWLLTRVRVPEAGGAS